jgi:mevalonate kinase
MFYNFQTTTHGKWILAGEHAVLRGHSALVFPIKEKKLTLTYTPANADLNADYEGSSGDDMHLLFWSVLEQGQQLLGQSLNRLTGRFHLNSNIPIGVGMGASAALCVAMSRWFAAQNLIATDAVASFAKSLENLFHGQSSGLDIAGVAADTGAYFKKGEITPLTQAWQPNWYLSSSGQVGITSHCITQVNKLWDTNSEEASQIDAAMSNAVDKSRRALEVDHPTSLLALKEAINESADCFRAWGLVSNTLGQHMESLLAEGAMAAKPTGSGGGGYVLSLWDKKPPALPFELIAV